jgi:hypothetical protein
LATNHAGFTPDNNCRFCQFAEILGGALTDVAADYEAAMRTFPVRQAALLGLIAASLVLPLHVTAQRLIQEYLALGGHGDDTAGALFRPIKNNVTGELDRPLNPNSVYRNIVQKYGPATGASAQVSCLRFAG